MMGLKGVKLMVRSVIVGQQDITHGVPLSGIISYASIEIIEQPRAVMASDPSRMLCKCCMSAFMRQPAQQADAQITPDHLFLQDTFRPPYSCTLCFAPQYSQSLHMSTFHLPDSADTGSGVLRAHSGFKGDAVPLKVQHSYQQDAQRHSLFNKRYFRLA